MLDKFPKVAVITNIPSPYRVTLFDHLHTIMENSFYVVYCNEINSNLPWKKSDLKHNFISLKESKISFLNFNFLYHKNIWHTLRGINPSIIITGGFKPSMLISILYAKIYDKKHFITTDAWEHTEKNYSKLHILIRKIIYKYADAFLPVSEKGKINFLKYGVNINKIFKVPYCINHHKYNSFSCKKEYDLLFSGQFIDRKLPFFFCEVAKKVKMEKKDLKILLIGKGPLQKEIESYLVSEKIDFSMPGFIQQEQIIYFYKKCKIFLFPTKSDGWGIVANEACAAGLPVITTPYAGVADELVIDGYNGFILDLDVKTWAEKILKLLKDEKLYNEFSKNALSKIEEFSVEKAATDFAKSLIEIAKN